MIRRTAFSLIELLVSIAIIAALLGLLLPGLSNARRRGAQAVCLNNMRQIVMAVMMYQQDNQDWYPSTMETASTGFPSTVSWWAIENYQAALNPYIQSEKGGIDEGGQTKGKRSVWFDPSDPDAGDPAMWGSFTDNGLITGTPRQLAGIARPAETVYATLREKEWSTVVGVSVPAVLPVQSPNDPFWSSEYFDMCLDPWSPSQSPSDPYHWTTGRAVPPCDLLPGEPGCTSWDQQIDGRSPALPGNKPRYGTMQPYSFCDGHAEAMAFEQTYQSPGGNFWDVK